MKKYKILRKVLKITMADKIISSFVLFNFIAAFVIFIVEPKINNYGDALWYCYTVFSTIGFGSMEAATIIGKLVSVVLTVYTMLVAAIVTGVVVSFYSHYVQAKYDTSVYSMLDKLENLENLSKEELRAISEKIKKNR